MIALLTLAASHPLLSSCSSAIRRRASTVARGMGAGIGLG
jgi:hypothetical protein